MKIHTNINDQLVKIIGEHSHPTEQEIILVLEFGTKVKERAVVETTPVPRIYEEECINAMLSNIVIAMLHSECEISEQVLSYA